MGFLHSQIGLVVLWMAAGLSALWILGPMILFLSPLRKLTKDVFGDPRLAEDPGNDADFARRIAELKALGFAPVGKTRERCRFFTPLHWNRVWNGCRWFASPDRKVFVEIHRLASGHPQRMTANTTFEGGGLLVTATAPLGMGGEIGERYRRVEVGNESVAELVREHERHVSDFSREAGLRVKAATVSDIATEESVMAKPFLARHRLAWLYAIPLIYFMPLFSMVGVIGPTHRNAWPPPLMLCGMAVLFAVIRLTVLPEFRRVRWIAFAALMALALGSPMLLARLPRHRLKRDAGNHPNDVVVPVKTP
jgi:hypothetical protein